MFKIPNLPPVSAPPISAPPVSAPPRSEKTFLPRLVPPGALTGVKKGFWKKVAKTVETLLKRSF